MTIADGDYAMVDGTYFDPNEGGARWYVHNMT